MSSVCEEHYTVLKGDEFPEIGFVHDLDLLAAQTLQKIVSRLEKRLKTWSRNASSLEKRRWKVHGGRTTTSISSHQREYSAT